MSSKIICTIILQSKDGKKKPNNLRLSSLLVVLIQEIYSKQKQRDQAMMGRLRLANEERDRAVSMANALKQGESV